MPTWLYEVAYGISRGFWDAYLDALAHRETAKEEKPNAEDLARRDRLHAAWLRMQPGAAGKDPAKPFDPAPPLAGGGGNGVGTP